MRSRERSSAISPRGNRDTSADEEELLRAAKSGSHTAFAELQKMYARSLYKRILSITKNSEDAEDALQEALIRAFRGLPSFEGRSKLSSWLMRIAINSALMTIRKRRSRLEISLDEPLGFGEDISSFDVPDNAMDPEQICDQKQRCERIRRAVHRLDPNSRKAIYLRISKDECTKAMTHEREISKASAKSRLHRARKRLIRFHPAVFSERS
jgi:RNA polymerase sigma-70 factor, ECF subfamily